MFNIFNKKRKIKQIPLNQRHKPTLILNPKSDRYYNKLKRKRIPINFKAVLLGLLGLSIILGILYLLNLFFTTSNYKLKTIVILGNKTVTEQEINTVVGQNIGKNLLLISTGEISADIIKAYPIINGVDITKFYPDKLFIKLNEREPKMVFINLNGSYVIDAQSKILAIIKTEPIDYPEEKLTIARGIGDYNSKSVQDYFLAEFIKSKNLTNKTEEEKQKIIQSEFNFNAILQADKIKVLAQLSKVYQKEISDIFAKNAANVLATEYKDLPEVYVLENKEWKFEEEVDKDKQNITLELYNYLIKDNLDYDQIRWEGSIIVKVLLKNDKVLIFGTTRSIAEQWEDYLLVVNDLAKRGKGYSSIDVSSTKISVIN